MNLLKGKCFGILQTKINLDKTTRAYVVTWVIKVFEPNKARKGVFGLKKMKNLFFMRDKNTFIKNTWGTNLKFTIQLKQVMSHRFFLKKIKIYF